MCKNLDNTLILLEYWPLQVLLADAGLAYILDRCLLFIFGEGRLRTKY